MSRTPIQYPWAASALAVAVSPAIRGLRLDLRDRW